MTPQRAYRWWMWTTAVLLMTLMVVGCAKKEDKKPSGTSGETGGEAAAGETGDETAAGDTGDETAAGDTGGEMAAGDTGGEAAAGDTGGEAAAGDTGGEAAAGDTGTTEVASFEVEVPLGLPELPIPEDNPMTAEKVELGKMLYFDKRLSKDGTVSCATCHDPKKAWAEHTPTSTGIGDEVGGANAPTVINAAYAKAQFWDGRAATLEDQALGPIANPIEMGHTLDAMVADLNKIDAYKEHFQKVFGTGVTQEGVAKAIAAFERTILSGNSPYDKYKNGDEAALTEVQIKGMKLFDDVGCSTCHGEPMFSSYRYYNAGVGMKKDPPDEGRMAVTKDEKDMGKFRVPSLREVANTAPYFHDGSCATLEEAVAIMAGGGIENDNLSAVLKGIGTEGVSDEDQAAIVEFLKALSGEYPIVEPPALP